MAEKDEPGEASFLDQFLRRLDQTDQEAAASPSASGTTMAAPSPSSEYSSAANPWSFISTASPLNPDLQYRPSPYMSLPANPLAEFPWLLEEFDQQQRLDAQRLYSPHEPDQVLQPSPSSSHGGEPSKTTSSSRDHAAGPVPRFGEPGSPVTVSKHMNYVMPPTSPLLSEATAAAVGAGSVTTSAGTSNTSVSSGSTSNAGDEEESGVKKEVATEGASSGKRKEPEPESETPDSSKKSDKLKHKPRKRGLAKRLREPRYAIKTRTDVDVLDDGFKWRKYGQKAVKNSPHPRNYYRCTTPQCPVRKRVERSNEDSGLVITTYEGTHTHQTPGFHRPSAGGYFGDRPGGGLGLGSGGLFQSPLGPGSTLLPLPPGFDLASLQQAAALRNIRGLQPNQNLNQSLLPGSSSSPQFRGIQQDSLFRAQQFLGLHDGGAAFVKQEPFQFSAQDFMSRNLASLPALPNPSPQMLINRSSPLFSGLNLPHLQPSPDLNISRPASSSNISSGQPPGRHELQPGAGSSRIDQSLETLVSSSSAPKTNDQAQGADQTRGRAPAVQQHRQQQQQKHQHQHQQGIRTSLSSAVSSENLQGDSETVAREGLLQDMVRSPKVSKS